MSEQRRPADVFPVAHFLQEEIQERGWGERYFKHRANLNDVEYDDIMLARKPLSRAKANGIGFATGTSPEMWMRLDAQFWESLRVELDAGITEAPSDHH